MGSSKVFLSAIILAVTVHIASSASRYYTERTRDGREIKFITEKPKDYNQSLFDEFEKTANRLKREEWPYSSFDYCSYVDKLQEDDDGNNCKMKCDKHTLYGIEFNDKTYEVVQTRSFTQNVFQITCKSESKEGRCFKDVYELEDYFTKCEQVSTKIKLFVFDPDMGKLEHKTFPFNTWCQCVVYVNKPKW